MKSNYTKFFLLALLAVFTLGSCSDDDDNGPSKLVITLGAQSNANTGAFYSVSENKVYKQDEASLNQDKIDLLCFYENVDENIGTHVNYTSLSSPGANITGIFTGETTPDNWTTKNLTTFTPPATELTTEEFDQIANGDAIISSYYDESVTSGNKKAKTLVVDNIYAFKTQDGTYGLFKVLELSNPEGADGWVKFELKVLKPTE